MTTRQIQQHLEEIYRVEVSPSLISTVTDAVIDEVRAWQSRPLEAIYAVVYFDCLVVKIRDGAHIPQSRTAAVTAQTGGGAGRAAARSPRGAG